MWGTKRNTFRTKQREKVQYKRRILYSGVSALIVALIAVLVWYGARRPEVTIASVTVEGGSTVPHELVKMKAESALSGSYALLIPKRFSYSVPLEGIVASVNSVPRVHSASAARISRTELKVTFEEYVPYALWCESVTAVASGTPELCMFVDEKGYAFSVAPQLSGETLVRFMVDGRAPSAGEYVYDADTLSRYRNLISAISLEHEGRLRAMTETKDGDLVLHLSQGPNLFVTKVADVHDIFESIESILSSPEYKEVPLSEFEYIDLRFGNKVYVKRRGVEQVVAPDAIVASSTPIE